MKRLKVSTIISMILCINYLLIPNSMVYADSLVHVHKDYNNSSNSVDLYVNGIEDTVTENRNNSGNGTEITDPDITEAEVADVNKTEKRVITYTQQ